MKVATLGNRFIEDRTKQLTSKLWQKILLDFGGQATQVA